MQHFIPLFVPLFYADKRAFFLFIYSEKQNIIFS